MSQFIMFSIDVFDSLFIVALGLLVVLIAIFYIRDERKQSMLLGGTIP